jgi:hypothetical protein
VDVELNQVMSILRFNWDVPLRIAVSVLTIALLAGSLFGLTALQAGSYAAEYLVDGAGETFALAQDWIGDRSALVAVVGIVLLFSIFFVGRGPRYRGAGRAPAAFLLGVWAVSESGLGWLPLLVWGGFVAARVVAVVVRIVVLNAGRLAHDYELGRGAITVESWLRRTWVGPVIAAVYIPFAPLAWAFA